MSGLLGELVKVGGCSLKDVLDGASDGDEARNALSPQCFSGRASIPTFRVVFGESISASAFDCISGRSRLGSD